VRIAINQIILMRALGLMWSLPVAGAVDTMRVVAVALVV